MDINQITRKKVSDEVFDQLKDMISHQVWKEGEKIPSQNELQEMFHVSRVSIREALKKLESYGIISTQQGRGSYVARFEDADWFGSGALKVYRNNVDAKTMRDFMEFRRIIELESVVLATRRATADDIRALEINYRQMVEARGDIQMFADYDFRFHELLAEITRNRILVKCFTMVLTFLKKDFDAVVKKVGTGKGTYYHQKILDAVREGQSERARLIMAEHLEATSAIFFEMNQ